jgi:hypothetical protein
MYTTKACAGVLADDDAQIVVTRQTGQVQAHNLSVGEYVLIRGSNTVPNIDGIHKVTSVDPTDINKFYIDQYIEQEGNAGNIYPLRNVRFANYFALQSALTEEVNGVNRYNFASVRQNNTSNPIYMYVDRISDTQPHPGVYRFSGNWTDASGHSGSLELVREAHVQCQNKNIENVKIYDGSTDSTLITVETFDPVKGVLFGFVRDEVEFIISNDIASYNYNTLDGSIDNYKTWGKEELGKRWWNINTSVYFNYEQGTVDQIQQSWGKLFDGASIDIYEWTRSTVLPEQWENAVTKGITIDGNQASGEAYYTVFNGEKIYYWTEEQYYNTRTKNTETYYYFWVKSKTSSYGQRKYNTNQLSVLLTNPSSYEIAWCAGAVDKNGDHFLLLNNVSSYLTKNSVVQVNQLEYNNAMPLQEWTLLSENNPTCYIPEYLHIKIRDSLCGFNNYQERYTFTTWNAATTYAENQVVKEGTDYYHSLANNNVNHQPSLDTAMTYWRKIYDYRLAQDTQQDDIDVWYGQEVPDRALHKFNRYGHTIRPRQSLYRDLREARHNFVDSANKLLAEINIWDEIGNWESTFNTTYTMGGVDYKTSRYWNWIDWYVSTFDTQTRADNYYDSKADMLAVSNQIEDSYNLVEFNLGTDNINRPEMYYYKDGEYTLVWKAKATIELSEEFWNESKFGNGFDTGPFDLKGFDDDSSFILSRLLNNLRSKIFKGRHFVKYNKLWFDLLKQAVLQNTTSDFAFKTTYVDLKVNHPLLTEQEKYLRFDVGTVEKFFESIKPFHTKLHNSIESASHAEATITEVTEQDRQSIITLNYSDHSTRDWACDTVLTGGDFTTTPEHTDISVFTTVDSDFQYIYNGNIFVQPVCEGWGDELVPTDFTENISISVQTNPQGTVTAGATYSVNAQENNPRGVTFNTDGTKMFIIGTTGDDVNEYTLSVGFDLTSTVTFVDSYVVTECPNPTAVKFNTDGTKMFVTGTSNSNVHEYALSTGFDVSTASFTQTLVTTVDSDNFGLDFKDDGTKMYITGNQNDKIYEYNLSSAFDISTATFNQDLSTQPHDYEPFGIEWSPDGTRLFIVGTIHNGVDLWYVSTPWDISTATHQEFYSIGGNPSGIHISPDGTKMFVVGNSSDLVKSYTLSVPYEFTTSSIASANSRAFRMEMYYPNNIQISTVIEDSRKTTTHANVSVTDTTIPVVNSTSFDDYGVVWIGSERIEYGARDPHNLLYCTRGTHSTPIQEHTSGTTVIEQNERIPTLESFAHYGDNLRLAYNDSGVSLSDPGSPGISPEHAFIRNAGQGSI